MAYTACQVQQSVQDQTHADLEARLALEEMGFSSVQVDRALLLTVQDFQHGMEYLLGSAVSKVETLREPSQRSGKGDLHNGIAKRLLEPRGLDKAEIVASAEPNLGLSPGTLDGNAAIPQDPAAHSKILRPGGRHAPIPAGMPPT